MTSNLCMDITSQVLTIYSLHDDNNDTRTHNKGNNSDNGDIDSALVVRGSPNLLTFDAARQRLAGVMTEKHPWDFVNLGLGPLCGGRNTLAADSFRPCVSCRVLCVYHGHADNNDHALSEQENNLHHRNTVDQGLLDRAAVEAVWSLLCGAVMERRPCKLVNLRLGSLCGGRNTLAAESGRPIVSCRVLCVYRGPADSNDRTFPEQEKNLHHRDSGDQGSLDLADVGAVWSLLCGAVIERRPCKLVNLRLGSLCGGRNTLAARSCRPIVPCRVLCVYRGPADNNDRTFLEQQENLHHRHSGYQGSLDRAAVEAVWSLHGVAVMERRPCNLVNLGPGSLCGGRNTLAAENGRPSVSCRVLCVYRGPADNIDRTFPEQEKNLHHRDSGDQGSLDRAAVEAVWSLLCGAVMERRPCKLVNLRLGPLCGGRNTLAAENGRPIVSCRVLCVYRGPADNNDRTFSEQEKNIHHRDSGDQGSLDRAAVEAVWSLLCGAVMERRPCKLVNLRLGSLCGGRNTLAAESCRPSVSCRVLCVYRGPADNNDRTFPEQEKNLHDRDSVDQGSLDLTVVEAVWSLLCGVVMERRPCQLVNLRLGSLCGSKTTLAAENGRPIVSCRILCVYRGPADNNDRTFPEQQENLHHRDTVDQGSLDRAAVEAVWSLLCGAVMERRPCKLVNLRLGSLCGGRNTLAAESCRPIVSCRVLCVYRGPADNNDSTFLEQEENLHHRDSGDQGSLDLAAVEAVWSLLCGAVMERRPCKLVNLRLGSLCGGRNTLAAESCRPIVSCRVLCVFRGPADNNDRTFPEQQENLHHRDSGDQGSLDRAAVEAVWSLLGGAVMERRPCKLVNLGLGSLCGGRNTLAAESCLPRNVCRIVTICHGPADYNIREPPEQTEHLHDGGIVGHITVQGKPDHLAFGAAWSLLRGVRMGMNFGSLFKLGLGSFRPEHGDLTVSSGCSEKNDDSVGRCRSKLDSDWIILHVTCLLFSAIVYVVAVGFYWIVFL